MRNSIVFRNSASADRSGMTASRFIVAAAACVILLYFGVESRKSQQNGAVKRRNGVLAAIFFQFWQKLFSFQNSFDKRLQNRSLSVVASRSGFRAANRYNCMLPFYCLSQLSVCRSHWNGCVKVRRYGSYMRNAIVF